MGMDRILYSFCVLRHCSFSGTFSGLNILCEWHPVTKLSAKLYHWRKSSFILVFVNTLTCLQTKADGYLSFHFLRSTTTYLPVSVSQCCWWGERLYRLYFPLTLLGFSVAEVWYVCELPSMRCLKRNLSEIPEYLSYGSVMLSVHLSHFSPWRIQCVLAFPSILYAHPLLLLSLLFTIFYVFFFRPLSFMLYSE